MVMSFHGPEGTKQKKPARYGSHGEETSVCQYERHSSERCATEHTWAQTVGRSETTLPLVLQRWATDTRLCAHEYIFSQDGRIHIQRRLQNSASNNQRSRSAAKSKRFAVKKAITGKRDNLPRIVTATSGRRYQPRPLSFSRHAFGHNNACPPMSDTNSDGRGPERKQALAFSMPSVVMRPTEIAQILSGTMTSAHGKKTRAMAGSNCKNGTTNNAVGAVPSFGSISRTDPGAR